MLGGKRARCHDRGNAASESHDERHEAASRQAELAQELVHEECDACHVARILERRKQQEQHDDDGQKREDRAHAGKHAIANERDDERVDLERFEPIAHGLREPLDALA